MKDHIAPLYSAKMSSDFEVDGQLVSMKAKDLTLLVLIRCNLRYYQVSRVLFYLYLLFRMLFCGAITCKQRSKKGLLKREVVLLQKMGERRHLSVGQTDS